MKRQFKLEEGEKLNRSPNKPIIQIVAHSNRTNVPYLWIGNNQQGDKCCFATLTGRRALKAMAEAILNACGEEK